MHQQRLFRPRRSGGVGPARGTWGSVRRRLAIEAAARQASEEHLLTRFGPVMWEASQDFTVDPTTMRKVVEAANPPQKTRAFEPWVLPEYYLTLALGKMRL